MVRVTAYGGIAEIGGNKILVEDGDTRVLLDFGMSFSAHGSYFAEFMKPRTNTEGLDLLKLGILPKLDGIYRDDVLQVPGSDDLIRQHPEAADLWRAGLESYGAYGERHGAPFVDAVVLTHAHLDHFGHLGFLDPRIPVDCTPITKGLVEAIETVSRSTAFSGEVVQGAPREMGEVSKGNFPGAAKLLKGDPWTREFRAREPLVPFQVGALAITLIPVDHSVPGGAMVLVEASDGKRILYSGDVRFHGRFDAITKTLRDTVTGLQPDLFLCEGTRLDSLESDGEADVRRGLVERFRDAPGAAFVDFAWKDTTRFQTLQEVAETVDRQLVVSHKLAFVAQRIAPLQVDLHPIEAYPNVSVYIPRKRSMVYSLQDYNSTQDRLNLGYQDGDWDADAEGALAHWERGVQAADIREHPERYLVTVSQWSMTELLDIAPPPGSVFVRAACEPFSEEMDLDLQRQARWLQRYGIPVAERDGEDKGKDPIPQVAHASGHAGQADLLNLVDRVDPALLLPIHTVKPEIYADHREDVLPWDRGPDGSVTVEL